MITGHEHDLPALRGRRDAEAVSLALDDERRDLDRVELGETAHRSRAAAPLRRHEREGEAEDAGRAGRLGRATGHPRARGAAAGDEREPVKRAPSRSCATTAVHAVSSWCAGAWLRRPATRYGCSTSATLTRSARAASVAATRSGAVTPPPAP